MTKAQILTQLNSLYKGIAIPAGNPELVETVGAVKKYLFHLLETGQANSDGTPVAYKRFIPIYVWDEGGAGEAAYYNQTAPENSVDRNISAVDAANPTLAEVSRAFNSTGLRARAIAAMLKAAFAVFWEAVGTTNHAQRMKWAVAVQTSPNAHVDQVMSVLALNVSVLGGNPTDAQIQNEINGYLDKWAVTLYS